MERTAGNRGSATTSRKFILSNDPDTRALILLSEQSKFIYNNRFVFEIAKEDIFLTSSRKRELLFTMQHLINNIRYRNSYTLFDHNNIDISITHIEDHGISLLIYVSII